VSKQGEYHKLPISYVRQKIKIRNNSSLLVIIEVQATLTTAAWHDPNDIACKKDTSKDMLLEMDEENTPYPCTGAFRRKIGLRQGVFDDEA
jgi:hypothetical protein